MEVVADLHLRPYYGEEYESTEELYNSLAKAGTTTFHGYATLYARVRNKRYTLAVRRLTDGLCHTLRPRTQQTLHAGGAPSD
ncbi:transposase (ISH3) [Halococcus thailandensis JCM 13552]|uniref:Transposase (ISH3) n=1 Tax=Halococcus thailandensis JCM 13552 TaxID=1227457 RepID=M0N141_9EURY|nr:transposase (ISH3) [Halococcus thailandensis JCM 13552]